MRYNSVINYRCGGQYSLKSSAGSPWAQRWRRVAATNRLVPSVEE